MVDRVIDWYDKLPAKRVQKRRLDQLEGILIHRYYQPGTASPEDMAKFFVEKLNYHRAGYTFYCWRGDIHQLAPVEVMTPHASVLNRRYIGVAIYGDARLPSEAPGGTPYPMMTPADIESAVNVCGELCAEMNWLPELAIYGHTRKIKSVAWPDLVCPGGRLDIAGFRSDVSEYMKRRGENPNPVLRMR